MSCYIPQLVDDPSSPVEIMSIEIVQTNSPSNFVSSQVCFSLLQNIIKVRKRAKIKNRYNQVPHLIQETMWESDKNTRKHHTQ